jgi:hypothetical protein
MRMYTVAHDAHVALGQRLVACWETLMTVPLHALPAAAPTAPCIPVRLWCLVSRQKQWRAG